MRRASVRILAATTALWLVVAGCGDLPTVPRLDSGGGATGASAVASPGSGTSAVVVNPGSPPPAPALPVGPALETSAQVDGAQGGVIQVEAVSVTVPPFAFNGDAQIKVTVPDSTKLAVQLEISPPDKNLFATPVRLEFDARAMGKDPRTMVIFWRNPANNRWVPIPTDVDMRTGKVSADLAHFSDYQCDSEVQGRAGW